MDTSTPTLTRAATLIDYQNIFYFLRNRLTSSASPDEVIVGTLNRLRQELETSEHLSMVVANAYADFGSVSDNMQHVQKTLALYGIDPAFVPNTMHKNATAMQLSIDATRLLYDRPDIETYVIVTGDRDYIPVVQYLQRQNKNVIVVAFRHDLSALLIENLGTGQFYDAQEYVSEDVRDELQDQQQQQPSTSTEFNDTADLPYDIDREVLEIIEEHFGQYDEVYLTPLLRKLSEELGDLEDHDPKSLIGDLENAGAVRLERRRGFPYDYTVLLVNPNHPEVQAVREEFAAENGDDYERPSDFGYKRSEDYTEPAEEEQT